MNHYGTLIHVPQGSLKIPKSASQGTNSSLKKLHLSLVIPTYQESDNINKIIAQLTELLDRAIPHRYELIVVDDNSPDCTWKLALELSSKYPQLRVMRREKERGLSTAVIRGWQAARGEILGVIDGDLQHPPETLWQLWAEMKRGADLAVASRHIEGGGVSNWNFLRRFLSRGAQIVGLVLFPEAIARVSDPMSGYFMVRRDAIADISLDPIGYKILIEVLGRGKIRWIGEVGYVFQERSQGESKVSWKQYLEYVQHLWRLRWACWPLGRFLRFGVVGFSGIFVDMAMFSVFREGLGLGLSLSAMLSGEVAIINNFLWNDLWTFGDIASRQRGWAKGAKRLLKFNLICLAGLVLNVFIVNLLSVGLSLNEYWAKLMAIAAVTLWNFWINLKLNWRVTEIDK